MLDSKHDRMDYGERLCPPPGYRFDKAIATTYGADLTTLLAIPVALVYAQSLEGDLAGERLGLLHAVERFSSDVRVYHQAGRLKVPAKKNVLFAYLEETLVPITQGDAYSNFHPKLWLVRYVPEEGNSKPDYFRLLVLSRNLSFSADWDVAACLEGPVDRKSIPENKPLVDFVGWLEAQGNTKENDWIEGFLGDLARAEFTSPEGFETHRFHPVGIPGYSGEPYPISAERCLVISPFVDNTTIRDLRKHTKNSFHLFGEPMEMAGLTEESMERVDAYCLHAAIAEPGFEEDEASFFLEDPARLHAKVLGFKREGGFHWFLGSANATQAARVRNVEFMLELTGLSGAVSIGTIKKELCGPNREGVNGPFVPFHKESFEAPTDEDRAVERELRELEHALVNCSKSGSATPAENAVNFDLELDIDLSGVAPRTGFKLSVEPFNVSSTGAQPLKPGENSRLVFRNLSPLELSRFVKFRIDAPGEHNGREFLLFIEVQGLPGNRLSKIMRQLVRNEAKFFEYLRFLLGEDIGKEDLLHTNDTPSGHDDHAMGDGSIFASDAPLFERLLVTASRRPELLAKADAAIQRLTENEEEADDERPILSEEFLSFWDAFKPLIPSIRHRS